MNGPQIPCKKEFGAPSLYYTLAVAEQLGFGVYERTANTLQKKFGAPSLYYTLTVAEQLGFGVDETDHKYDERKSSVHHRFTIPWR